MKSSRIGTSGHDGRPTTGFEQIDVHELAPVEDVVVVHTDDVQQEEHDGHHQQHDQLRNEETKDRVHGRKCHTHKRQIVCVFCTRVNKRMWDIIACEIVFLCVLMYLSPCVGYTVLASTVIVFLLLKYVVTSAAIQSLLIWAVILLRLFSIVYSVYVVWQ